MTHYDITCHYTSVLWIACCFTLLSITWYACVTHSIIQQQHGACIACRVWKVGAIGFVHNWPSLRSVVGTTCCCANRFVHSLHSHASCLAVVAYSSVLQSELFCVVWEWCMLECLICSIYLWCLKALFMLSKGLLWKSCCWNVLLILQLSSCWTLFTCEMLISRHIM